MQVEALVFGSLALAWCLVLFYKALFPAEHRNVVEFYMMVPFSMWLAGNYVWMFGKLLGLIADRIATAAVIMQEPS